MTPVRSKILEFEDRRSRDIFSLFSALNAMGYDEENNPAGMSPMRKRVRNTLAKYDWARKYPRLRREAKTGQPWWALNAILARPKDVGKSSKLGGLFPDLEKFSKEPSVRKLRSIYKTQQNKEAKKLARLLEREVPRFLAFIGQPLGVKNIIFIANPLDAYWRGYAFGATVGFWRGPAETGYVVVGPGAEKDQGELIRHELLHIIAPPLRLPRKIIGRRPKRLAAMGYSNLNIINREYIIRALNLFYKSAVLKKDVSKEIRSEEKDFPDIRKAMELLKQKTGRL